jgi:hypothetical protein
MNISDIEFQYTRAPCISSLFAVKPAPAFGGVKNRKLSTSNPKLYGLFSWA